MGEGLQSSKPFIEINVFLDGNHTFEDGLGRMETNLGAFFVPHQNTERPCRRDARIGEPTQDFAEHLTAETCNICTIIIVV
jgi:hypothetical protein